MELEFAGDATVRGTRLPTSSREAIKMAIHYVLAEIDMSCESIYIYIISIVTSHYMNNRRQQDRQNGLRKPSIWAPRLGGLDELRNIKEFQLQKTPIIERQMFAFVQAMDK